MAGFGLVDVTSRAVHSGFWSLHLQMVRAVFSQNNIGQLERLLAEIPMSHESLFGGRLTSVIVEQAKRARNWDKFVKVAERCGLKNVLTMVG